MDSKLLRALSELQARSRGYRGIQWELHVQRVRPARWLVRHLPVAYSVHVPSTASCRSGWPRWSHCLGPIAYSSSMAAATARRSACCWMPCKTRLATCRSTLQKNSCSAQWHHLPTPIQRWKCFRCVLITQVTSHCPCLQSPSHGESPTFPDRPLATLTVSQPNAFCNRLRRHAQGAAC